MGVVYNIGAGLVVLLLAGTACAEAVTVEEFTPELGGLVAIGVDEAADLLFLYPTFGDVQVQQLDGTPVSSYEQPGNNSNDFDLDVAHVDFMLAAVEVPAGSLLIFNGESDPQRVWAVEPVTGTVISELVLGEPIGQLVGGSLAPDGSALYLVDWSNDVIRSFDMQTGAQLDSFSVQPEGSPSFDVFFGDMDVAANGNILIVSSSQTRIREITPDGEFVQDFDLGGLGLPGMSGIDTSPDSRVVYACSTGGLYWRITGVPVLTPACAADFNADGTVDSTDLNLLLANFGQFTTETDANCDGVANSDDLNVLLGAFGNSCDFQVPE